MATCIKCGGEVALSDALVQEMIKINPQGDAVVQHDVCPGQDQGERRFKIHISVTADEDTELAMFEVEHTSTRFADALPELAKKLEPRWAQLQKHAAIVDADLDA